jgi:hypothetical protein
MILLFWINCAGAVEVVAGTNSYYNSSNNISGTVTGWSSGWGTGNTNTGWDYVGSVNGASGVYLGNGWVLTAGHVGAGNFTLAGNVYDYTGSSYTFPNGISGTNLADLTLFRISTTSISGLNLAMQSLTISSNAPNAFSNFNTGSQVVMIGNGGGKSWGVNTVTTNNIGVTPGGTSYISIDFATAHGTTTSFTRSITNNAEFVVGDSGGGDFVDVSGNWHLAGINEAVDVNGGSYMIQLSSYDSQIQSIITAVVPEPDLFVLVGLGVLVIFWKSIIERSKNKDQKSRFF